MTLTPVSGLNSVVTTGGTAVIAAAAFPCGGYIENPLSAADQGIASAGLINAEPLYIDIVGMAAMLAANGTIVALQPGERWDILQGQTTPTYVNAETSGHMFTVVVYVQS